MKISIFLGDLNKNCLSDLIATICHAIDNVTGFWTKMGFTANGNKYEFPGEAKVAHVQEYEKEIKKSI